MQKLLHRLASTLSPPRVIENLAHDPYLSRYYLFRSPDGSRRLPFGTFLHCFHRSDEDRDLHNHPWGTSVSVILYGGYIEERLVGDRIVRRVFRPGSINVIRKNDFHRVDLLADECWTLFFAGFREQSWGFRERDTGRFVDYRDYPARA